MQPRYALVPAIALLTLLLAAAGCASAPSPPPTEPSPAAEAEAEAETVAEAETDGGEAPDSQAAAGDADAAIRFHVDGPGTDEGSCALRFSALHGSGLEPVDVELEIEVFRVSDGIFVSSMASTYALPMVTAIETVDGMESPITGDNLNLPCDDLRAEIRVVSCDPSPCPSVGVQPGYNQVPLTVSGPEAG